MNTSSILLLERILSADSKALERSGFLPDKISQRCGDSSVKKAREKHSAGLDSASIVDPPQQSKPDSRSKYNGPPGNFICKASDVSSDKSLDVAEYSTSLPLSWTVIPQSDIRNNVEKAIKASGLGEEELTTHTGMSQLLSNGFCKVPADVRSLRPIGRVKNIQVCVDEAMPDADTIMEQKREPLARFVDIVITLSEIYSISTGKLHIFYDVSGGCIAFNCQGTIYLNLRYFEVWHDEQVKSGNLQNAQMSWFLALAHEIAHNLTILHNSDHEFWLSAICEAHLVAFSQLLRPTNTRHRGVLRFLLVAIVILVAYLAQRILAVTSIPR